MERVQLAQLIDPRGHRTAIIGITGSGKTYYAIQMFQSVPVHSLYIDYAAAVRRNEWANALRPLVVHDCGGILRVWQANKNQNPNVPVKAVFEPVSGGDSPDKVIRWIMNWKQNLNDPKPLWVFCDEIHNYGDRNRHPDIGELFTRGRNSNVTGVAITQNLPQVGNTAIIQNCQVKICFALDQAAVKALARNYGIIVPDNVLAWCNSQSEQRPPERTAYNAAVYGLTGPEWRMI